MSKVKFDTDDYVAAHGKAPRGEGNWTFEPVVHAGSRGHTSLDTMNIFGTYTRAKREVAARVRSEMSEIGGAESATVFVGS